VSNEKWLLHCRFASTGRDVVCVFWRTDRRKLDILRWQGELGRVRKILKRIANLQCPRVNLRKLNFLEVEYLASFQKQLS